VPVYDLIDLPAACPPNTPWLGLDLGEKTIGVAISDPGRMVASPLELIRREKFTKDADRLMALMQARGASALLVGLPMNLDGTEGPRAQSVRAFVRNLSRLTADVPAAFWDERMSTMAVNRMLIGEADLSRAKRAEVVDRAAAAYILQGALERLRAA
jgi:putative Holliday junction resolvase